MTETVEPIVPTIAPHPELKSALTDLVSSIDALAQSTRVRSDHIAVTRLHHQATAILDQL